MNRKKIMIVAFSILGLLLISLLTGKIYFSIQFNKQVKTLYAESKNISGPIFHKSQLDNLPEPVQRYFNHVLKEGQPFIHFVRLTHDGQFKTGLDKEWVNIEGEQYFTTEKPGYIWKGATSMFTARDMYISDRGRLIVTLFSLFNIADSSGEPYNQGELLRWLAESVWFPTNLLPSERLQWAPFDARTAKLTFHYQELTLNYLVTFNEAGEIEQMKTKRYMNKENLEPWICKMSDYQEVSGVRVPMAAEALWRLEKGDFSYARFKIKKIEYNIPEKY